jgi:hypothetical protein
MEIAITKRHACHANSRGDHGIKWGIKRTTRASPVPKAPRLPRKMEVDVAKRYVCHAKWRSTLSSATSSSSVGSVEWKM